MKIKEIISELNKYDPDSDVLISPYACPGDDVNEVSNYGKSVEIG